MAKHVCSCGDCAVAPYEDRCKYEWERDQMHALLVLVAGEADEKERPNTDRVRAVIRLTAEEFFGDRAAERKSSA